VGGLPVSGMKMQSCGVVRPIRIPLVIPPVRRTRGGLGSVGPLAETYKGALYI